MIQLIEHVKTNGCQMEAVPLGCHLCCGCMFGFTSRFELQDAHDSVLEHLFKSDVSSTVPDPNDEIIREVKLNADL